MNLNNEANTQAEFYHQCRLLGVECALEVNTPFGRVDVAVLSDDRKRFLAIVEVKQQRVDFRREQIDRYKQIGVPVYGLWNPLRCEKLAQTIRARHGSERGVSLLEIQTTKRRMAALQVDSELNYKGERS